MGGRLLVRTRADPANSPEFVAHGTPFNSHPPQPPTPATLPPSDCPIHIACLVPALGYDGWGRRMRRRWQRRRRQRRRRQRRRCSDGSWKREGAYHTNHTIPYHTIPCHTAPYHAIPYHNTIPCYAMPYRHAMPFHAIPRAMPCHLPHAIYHTVPYHDHTVP